MSTIIASNISDGTTSVPSTYVVNGSAKAWVNFNGTGTVAIRRALNVSSLTDNGVGLYTANFTNAMVDADYAYSLAGGNAAGSTNYELSPTAFSTGSISVIMQMNVGTDTDVPNNSIAIFS